MTDSSKKWKKRLPRPLRKVPDKNKLLAELYMQMMKVRETIKNQSKKES